MDYSDIDRIITSHGLASEPAFQDVNITIQPIPNLNGCPLGLYFPSREYLHQFGRTIPEGTIIIPPDSYDSVLLHELGHRYGHYHHNNLSEQFAETYRKRYQGGVVLFYSGSDFRRLPKFTKLFEEGERGAIEVAFNRPIGNIGLSQFRAQLCNQCRSEPLPTISYVDNSMVRLEFTKGVDWFAIIAGSLTIAGLGAIAYAIYKTARETPWVFPLAIFGGLAAGLLVGRYITQHRLVFA